MVSTEVASERISAENSSPGTRLCSSALHVSAGLCSSDFHLQNQNAKKCPQRDQRHTELSPVSTSLVWCVFILLLLEGGGTICTRKQALGHPPAPRLGLGSAIQVGKTECGFLPKHTVFVLCFFSPAEPHRAMASVYLTFKCFLPGRRARGGRTRCSQLIIAQRQAPHIPEVKRTHTRRNSSAEAQELLFLLPDHLPSERAEPGRAGYRAAKPENIGLQGRIATSKNPALFLDLSAHKLPQRIC